MKLGESHSIAINCFVLERHGFGFRPKSETLRVSPLVASNDSELSVNMNMWKHTMPHKDLKYYSTALCWPADLHRMNETAACTSGPCCPSILGSCMFSRAQMAVMFVLWRLNQSII